MTGTNISLRKKGLRAFTECVRLPGHFGGAFGNCKWRDRASHCSVRDNQQAGQEVIVLDDGPNETQVVDLTGGQGQIVDLTEEDGSSQSIAIVLY